MLSFKNILFLSAVAAALQFVSSTSIGQSYFQQDVNYEINVTLDDKNHFLRGDERITYRNNSADTLRFLYFHLWPNAYSSRNTALSKSNLSFGDRDVYFATLEEQGYIDSLNFTVNEDKVEYVLDGENPDICKIHLQKPILPDEEVLIATPFRIKIPSANLSRFGHAGESYFISQWYPKPAVFDKTGWHPMPYLSQGEFYSEIGSFKVKINLPSNYRVAATGELQTESERLWLRSLSEQSSKIETFESDLTFPKSDKEYKTLEFFQDKVHDFAWFADKRFYVLRDEINIAGRDKAIESWAFFTGLNGETWKKTNSFLKEAVEYFSKRVGEYPYNVISAVEGVNSSGTGMEYPTITLLSSTASTYGHEVECFHEVGHNWFYGILANNERRYPWLDEGVNSYYEQEYFSEKYDVSLTYFVGGFFNKVLDWGKLNYRESNYMFYKFFASTHNDQASGLAATEYTALGYAADVYEKPALMMNHLSNTIGLEKFDECMQAYFNRWKFKHPDPNDMQQVFEEISGGKLDWFFIDWINSEELPDYKMVKVKKEDNGDLVLRIKNKSDLVIPFELEIEEEIGSKKSIWFKGFRGTQDFTLADNSLAKQVIINPNSSYPEMNEANNSSRVGGIVKKWNSPKLSFMGSYDDPNVSEIYYFPLMAWNNYDKWMMGLSLYNKFLPARKFEYSISPMYSISENSVSGLTNVKYDSGIECDLIENLLLSVDGRKFNYRYFTLTQADGTLYSGVADYFRLAPALNVKFKPKFARSSVTTSLLLSSSETFVDVPVRNTAGNFKLERQHDSYRMISFELVNDRELDKYSGRVGVEQHDDFIKASIQINNEISYKRPGKGIHLRLFGGIFIENNSTNRDYNFRMDGRSGLFDYQYNDLYFGRTETEGLLSQQFALNDGGFKQPNAVGQSNDWIISLNTTIDLPGPLPILFFTDIGTYADAGDFVSLENTILYSGGLAFVPIRNIFEIYFPLFESSDITTYLETNDVKFGEQIRFVLNLNALSPFKIRESF